LLLGEEGRGGGAARHFSQNGEQNAVTKISFDRQDIMLLSTTIRAGGKRQALNNPHQTHLCKNNAQGLLSLQATHPPPPLSTTAAGSNRVAISSHSFIFPASFLQSGT